MVAKTTSMEACSPERSERAKQWTLVALTTVALAFSIASITTCNFISVEGEGFPTNGFGIFQQDIDGQCTGYSDRTNGGHGMAKAFGILAVLTIAGALISIVAAIGSKKEHAKRSTFAWHTSRALLAGGLYSVLFTFFFYTSPLKRSLCSVEGADCKAGPGAIVTAVNSVLMAILVALSLVTLPPNESSSSLEGTKESSDRAVENGNAWFASNDTKAVESQTASASKQKRGWFGSKSSKVATGAAVVAGGTVAAVAATRDVEKQTKQTKSMTIEPVDDEAASTSWFGSNEKEADTTTTTTVEKKKGWFGKKSTGAAAGGAAVAVAARAAASDDNNDEESQSQRSSSFLSRKKSQQTESSTNAAVEKKETSSSNWFGSTPEDVDTTEKKPGWFRSKTTKVATGAAVAGGAVAATRAAATPADDNDEESQSQRSFLGRKKSQQKEPTAVVTEEAATPDSWFGSTVQEVETAEPPKKRGWFGSKAATGGAVAAATASAAAATSQSKRGLFGATTSETTEKPAQKRSLFGSLMRNKSNKEETNETENSPDNADTRRALFGTDVDSVDTDPKSVMVAKPTKAKAQSPEEGVIVSNESVSSSCPACYCLP